MVIYVTILKVAINLQQRFAKCLFGRQLSLPFSSYTCTLGSAKRACVQWGKRDKPLPDSSGDGLFSLRTNWFGDEIKPARSSFRRSRHSPIHIRCQLVQPKLSTTSDFAVLCMDTLIALYLVSPSRNKWSKPEIWSVITRDCRVYEKCDPLSSTSLLVCPFTMNN